MKRVLGFILLISCTVISVKAQLEKIPDLKPSNSFEDRKRVSRDLLNVRDSLNQYLESMTTKSEKERANPESRRRLNLAIDELLLSKDELDSVIEEVATTSGGEWGFGIQDKSYRTVRDARMRMKKIREGVKELISINS